MESSICENVHMKIDRAGMYFMDSVIGRERMIKLFRGRVLRLDQDGYYLVTPVEKIKIEVELKPFVIVDFELLEQDQQVITFKTNTDEIFEVNEKHPIKVTLMKIQTNQYLQSL